MLPTHTYIFRYFYFLKNNDESAGSWPLSYKIAEDLTEIWDRARIAVRDEKSIVRKIDTKVPKRPLTSIFLE